MMKQLKFAFLLVLVALSCKAFSQSMVEEGSIRSLVLNVARNYTVYLPASYASQPEKKYPVLYLLHGHSHRNKDWVKDGHLKEIADRLTAEKEACEMIVVTPDAGSVRNGYFNTEGWRYESFFFEEFIPFIEKKYRVIGDQAHRAIAGFSMGGGGAVAYAAKYPDMFSSVYAMSALMTLPKQERPPADMDEKKKTEMLSFGQSVLANDCIVLISYVDVATLEKLRAIKWFVDCGDDDFLLDVNVRFYHAMQEAKIPCELRVRDGSHDWKYWRSSLELALPFVSEHFVVK